jgi:alanine dehydrogenase
LSVSESPVLWLRAESKPGEARSALAPADAKTLLAAGFRITVEDSPQRVFATAAYKDVGCHIAAAGSWIDAPAPSFILGLKELPADDRVLGHRHIYFGHAYKYQSGWAELLRRFAAGGGQLLDLEYLVDEKGRRLAAFGYWAGFVGTALAVMTWCRQHLGLEPGLPELTPWPDSIALLEECRRLLTQASARPVAAPALIVIGAGGRVGNGAMRLAGELGLEVTPWDLAETSTGGPFADITGHEIFINCVLVGEPLPPFLTPELIATPGRKLRVIADVSCDPYGEYNPLPLYQRCTTLQNPTLRLIAGETPLDLIAIDHLPSLLPRESSEDFSRQLLPALLHLAVKTAPEWDRSLACFERHCRELESVRQ